MTQTLTSSSIFQPRLNALSSILALYGNVPLYAHPMLPVELRTLPVNSTRTRTKTQHTYCVSAVAAKILCRYTSQACTCTQNRYTYTLLVGTSCRCRWSDDPSLIIWLQCVPTLILLSLFKFTLASFILFMWS